MQTKIILVDDDAIVLDSLHKFLSFQDEIEVFRSFRNAENYIEALAGRELDLNHILLLDIGLSGMSGLDAIPEIKRYSDHDIIMLSTYEETDKILEALRRGASSYISKRAGLKAILEGIEIVRKGGAYLSPNIAREIVRFFGPNKDKIEIPDRQKAILIKLTEGLSYREIASQMNISVETVRSHVKKMYRLLQVNNKTQAIGKFHRGSIQ